MVFYKKKANRKKLSWRPDLESAHQEGVGGVEVGHQFAGDPPDLHPDVHARPEPLVLDPEGVVHPFELASVEDGLSVDLLLQVLVVTTTPAPILGSVVVFCVESRQQSQPGLLSITLYYLN